MSKRIIFNVKPSHRMVEKFKTICPEATFYGAASLGSKSKSYLIPEDVYLQKHEVLKKYGSKARYQPD